MWKGVWLVNVVWNGLWAAADTDTLFFTDANIIPMHITGGVNTDLTKLTANDLMMWGLLNLWKSGEEGGYAAQHGCTPVNKFRQQNTSDVNLFKHMFPCLFPYRVGGIKGEQAVPADFREHVQWALEYYNHMFSTHKSFSFVAFAILQHRQVLTSVCMQISWQSLKQEAWLLSTVTVKKMQSAQAQEAEGELVSNPAVKLLKCLVHRIGSCI